MQGIEVWGRRFDKRELWTLLICAFLAYITYFLKVLTTPNWSNGTLEVVHAQLLSFTYYNNEQSRLLQFGIPELLSRVLNLTLQTAYAVQRLIFTTLALWSFHHFTRAWLREETALLAVTLLALLIPFSSRADLQESAPLLSFTFVAALWALREERSMLLSAIIFIGVFNNETMLFLPALYAIVQVRSWSMPHLVSVAGKALLIGLPGLLALAFIRYLTRDQLYLGGGWHWWQNLASLKSAFLFFGVFWVLALWRFRSLPVFLQRGLLSIPIFLVPNLMIGIITETRLLLPLGYIVLPAALYALFPNARVAST